MSSRCGLMKAVWAFVLHDDVHEGQDQCMFFFFLSLVVGFCIAESHNSLER